MDVPMMGCRALPGNVFWVAQNKTVPLVILEELRGDPDERVRSVLRAKRSWARAHPEDAKRSANPE